MHTQLDGSGLDFAEIDEKLADYLARAAPWLAADAAYLVRLGLHELLVNIRTHSYPAETGPIEISATATSDQLTVAVTDWGDVVFDLMPGALPRISDQGGYGLAIIDHAFQEVAYRRVSGRNHWVLRRHATNEPVR